LKIHNSFDFSSIISCAITEFDAGHIEIYQMHTRLKNWYGIHYPELIEILPDMHTYATIISLLPNRKILINLHQEK